MLVPEPGITTKAKVIAIPDGDTIKLEVTRTFNVRIRDLLVAEKNTEAGQRAIEYLNTFLKDSQVTLFVPSNDPVKLMDMNSFNRLVGDLWYPNGINMVDDLEEKKLGRRLRKGEKPHEGE